VLKKISLLLLALLAIGVFAGTASAKARGMFIWGPQQGPVIHP
jgi:hypothetical protein